MCDQDNSILNFCNLYKIEFWKGTLNAYLQDDPSLEVPHKLVTNLEDPHKLVANLEVLHKQGDLLEAHHKLEVKISIL